ncbi:putative secreted RxLR effector protein [Phytophthora cinnamomi]|uniref:putative secreted RxLR effector protein n=1 Tax=Phytophthora cinnamomi TaxID=4785 RepID=UPI002A2CA865|nr:putative secreted RxLR effector protein [Phytophthora cinnamomi]KAJ8576702.1 hypothetical protein ON010_g2508 [Phytophthora cinnamomi]QVE55562.1 RxLR effector protein 62 [Phytophthora cinnamomi]
MRLHFIVVLAVATLVATTTAADEPKTGVISDSVPSIEKDVPPTRHLRTIDDAGEERGITFSLPGLETATNIFKSPNQKILDKLVKSGQTPDQAFAFYKLDKFGNTLQLSEPNFKLWVKFVIKTNKKYASSIVLSKLQKQYGDDHKLAEMLRKAAKVEETKKTATKLEALLAKQLDAMRYHRASFQD